MALMTIKFSRNEWILVFVKWIGFHMIDERMSFVCKKFTDRHSIFICLNMILMVLFNSAITDSLKQLLQKIMV